jgi:hypothetical protein
MLRHVLAAALIVTAVAPAMAQDGDAPKPAKEKKVCKREIATGSVMPKVTCRTKAEWDAISARGQSDLDRTRDMERSRSAVGTALGN